MTDSRDLFIIGLGRVILVDESTVRGLDRTRYILQKGSED